MTRVSCATVFLSLSFLVLYASAGIARSEERNEEMKRYQICKEPLTLEIFRAHVLNNSPLIAEIDKDYAHQLANAFEKEVLANPEFQLEQTFTQMNVGGANDSQTQLSIGQAVKLSNFGAREKVADLMRRAGDIEKRTKLLELTQKLELQFRSLAVMQQTARILSASEIRANKKIATIRDGRKKGLLSEGDELLFEGEKYRLQAQAKGVAANIARLQNDLISLGGLRCHIQIDSLPGFEPLPSSEVLRRKSLANPLGEGARAEMLLSLNQEQRRLADLDRYPQLSPRFVYQHTNDGGDFFGAGISIPLPVWNKNQGEQIRSTAEERAAEVKKNFLDTGGLSQQIETLREASVNAEEQAKIFSEKVIPSFEGALKAQERLYLEGRGNVLEVWQTLRALNEVQSQGLQLWLEAGSARMQLAILVGEQMS